MNGQTGVECLWNRVELSGPYKLLYVGYLSRTQALYEEEKKGPGTLHTHVIDPQFTF